eukprot:8760711-Karenia_brevis.AAC.1
MCVEAVEQSQGPSTEAAYIGLYMPTANNVERTQGVLQPRHRSLSHAHRTGKSRKRACTRFRHLIVLGHGSGLQEDDTHVHEDDTQKNALVASQIESRKRFYSDFVNKCHDLQNEKHMLATPPKKVYWKLRDQLCKGQGPIDIHASDLCLLRFLASYPHQ